MQRGQVGGGEVLLAQVHEVGAGVERLAPVVVDDELAAVAPAGVHRHCDLAGDHLGRRVLDPELDGPDAQRQETGEPGRVRNDRVEHVEALEPDQLAHRRYSLRSKNGVPATGVEGAAMSRVSISPASQPRRPASTAAANARAMRTGSAAVATAVLRSTRVVAQLHGLGGVRGRADAGVDDEGHVREVAAQALERVAVGEAAAGADRRAPRHQDAAAGGDEALGGDQVLGGVGEYLEAVAREGGGGLHQAEEIRLQSVLVADHLELDPAGSEQLARHAGGGDCLLRGATAGGIGQYTYAEVPDEVEEALARST